MRRFSLLLAIVVGVSEAKGQVMGGVTGTLHTEAGVPIAGATVILQARSEGGTARSVESDARGQFRLEAVLPGTYEVRVQRIGFAPLVLSVLVSDERTTELRLALRPNLAQLDTVIVRDTRRGLFGVVGSRALRPLAGSLVSVLGGTTRTLRADSAGHFGVTDLKGGTYIVRIWHPSFAERLVSVTLPSDSLVDLVVLLDSGNADPRAIPQAWALHELEDRLPWMGTRAALVSRTDLSGAGSQPLGLALSAAAAVSRKGLRITDATCVFVNGEPAPGRRADSVHANDVETAEVYARDGDETHTLERRWNGGKCPGNGALTPGRGAPSNGNVAAYVVIWLRR